MYFNELENKNGTKEDKLVTKDFLEQGLEKFKQECKEETLRELLRIFVASRVLGQSFMAPSPTGKQYQNYGRGDCAEGNDMCVMLHGAGNRPSFLGKICSAYHHKIMECVEKL